LKQEEIEMWRNLDKNICVLIAKRLFITDILSLRLVCKKYSIILGPANKPLWQFLCYRDFGVICLNIGQCHDYPFSHYKLKFEYVTNNMLNWGGNLKIGGTIGASRINLFKHMYCTTKF